MGKDLNYKYSEVVLYSENDFPLKGIRGLHQVYTSIVRNIKRIQSVSLTFGSHLDSFNFNLMDPYEFFGFKVKTKEGITQILIVSIENSRVASLESRDSHLFKLDNLLDVENSFNESKIPCIIIFRKPLDILDAANIGLAVMKSGLGYKQKFSRFLNSVQIYAPKGFVDKPAAPPLKKTLQSRILESTYKDSPDSINLEYVDQIIKDHFSA